MELWLVWMTCHPLSVLVCLGVSVLERRPIPQTCIPIAAAHVGLSRPDQRPNSCFPEVPWIQSEELCWTEPLCPHLPVLHLYNCLAPARVARMLVLQLWSQVITATLAHCMAKSSAVPSCSQIAFVGSGFLGCFPESPGMLPESGTKPTLTNRW